MGKEDKCILMDDLEIFGLKMEFVESLDIENNDDKVFECEGFEYYVISFIEGSNNVCVRCEYLVLNLIDVIKV